MNQADKRLEVLINNSIDLLKRHENLALKLNDKGFNIAFSGGKDSIVLYHLCKLANIKFIAKMNLTTVDPKELLDFIKLNYKDVILEKPKLSMFKLIDKKGILPLRNVRYCCEYLKEHAGINTVTLIGIRKEESSKRAKRIEFTHSCIKGYDKFLLSPILNYSKRDIWNFIKKYNLKYPSLYDDGFERIGCVFCPLANEKNKKLERIKFPKFENAYKKVIKKLINKGKYKEFEDENEVFNWWISNKSRKDFLELKKQTKLEL